MRHRLIGSVLVCLFSASIFTARYSANSPSLRVNESATKFSLKKEGAVVSLAVENSSSSALTARVKLELIDPRDAVRATAMIEASIPSGSGVSTVPMVKIGAGDYDVRELLWHRLRYDLPNFVVNVKPDHGYYLPGQNAEVVVSADYLFGAPVKRGRARVVRETERRWNYREQKWETEEGEKYEGALGDDGRFVARVDLAEEHKDFNPGSYSRFRDLRYAAYLTDSTTGRTEQRRFDLRVTRDPIHVYLIERVGAGKGLPLQFYISTFYADGSPSQCEVTINRMFGAEDDDESKAGNGNAERLLTTVKTNRYGVAKVASLDAGKTEGDDDLRLKLIARDDQGRSGRDVHEYGNHSTPAMRVETDKTLYRDGEPIKARLTSKSPRVYWTVDLMRGSRLLTTRAVQLKEGGAEITFPYNQEFGDELMIAAYPAFIDDYEAWNSAGVARVLYPRDRELKLDVKFDQASYRPGDEARADLRALTPQGRAAESAIGVVIFDKAIEERARTDQEFSGQGFGFYDCF